MAIVTCSHVCKTYQQGKVSVSALDDICLQFAAGEFSALAGPSGSGKTTLLNLIGGLDAPDSGQIVLDGQNVTTMSQSALAEMRLARIGFIFQSYNLIPVLSALENVEYVMLLQGVETTVRRERATLVLEEVGLGSMLHRRPAELSGGQQQRVAVARAIASRPALILADEPTANLDSKTGEALLTMMAGMNATHNITFLFSTHDHMVMDFAKRLVHLRDGRVEKDECK